jgi:hypothetical protein
VSVGNHKKTASGGESFTGSNGAKHSFERMARSLRALSDEEFEALLAGATVQS